ncbi:MAG TPA: YebC/PmpR family DNA-binding transcriptional regulator [Candidatus Paceibacterota bacterium]|nr:YebC/PmpR family DNA-binding transcriptional regulator [Candidatus Paceibacterota bacterium]
MSGHNKWSKIKHKKASSDASRSSVFSKHALLIAMESRKAQGNIRAAGLISAIERAKRDSMPKDNIDRAIARGAGVGGNNLVEVLYETYGPGGVAILITAITDNPNRTTPEIRHILNKSGFQLGNSGAAVWAFSKNGADYSPHTPVKLSDTDSGHLAVFTETLLEHADVRGVFTSADDVPHT